MFDERFFLILIAVFLAIQIMQRQYQYARVERLLNDLATMIGELFDVLGPKPDSCIHEWTRNAKGEMVCIHCGMYGETHD